MAIPGSGIAKGMATTLRNFFSPKVTRQYPEQRNAVKELVEQLMGRNPEHRFNFIQNRAGELDRDMIDERAREALNMANAKDIVIFLDPPDRRPAQ